jgi:uncharacterized protein (UPF0548 family)
MIRSRFERLAMFFIKRPNENQITRFLLRAAETDFTYAAHGATEGTAPVGYRVDHNRIELGPHWESAKRAIREWKMFDFPWVDLCRPTTAIETGSTVAILIRHFGFYSLNAARIVYTIDEPDRFGFAYGTLTDHGESGEERFMVQRDGDGKVWYDLKAFSRPNHVFAKFGYPVVWMLQKQFAYESKQAMFRAVRTIG